MNDLGFLDANELKRALPHWWFHLGKALSDVIMPVEYYKVEQNGVIDFDEIGLNEYVRNQRRYDFLESEADRITSSHYQFYLAYEEKILGRSPVEATQNAMRRLGFDIPKSTGAEGQLIQRAVVTAQLLLDLNNAIQRTKNSSRLEGI